MMSCVDGVVKIGALERKRAAGLGTKIPLQSWPLACTDISSIFLLILVVGIKRTGSDIFGGIESGAQGVYSLLAQFAEEIVRVD